MDTDLLSDEAYQGILVEAENFNHDLTVHFGVLASDCEDEAEYLLKAKNMITELKSMNEVDLVEDVFFGEKPDFKAFYQTLDKMLQNIEKVEQIPESKRTYDF